MVAILIFFFLQLKSHSFFQPVIFFGSGSKKLVLTIDLPKISQYEPRVATLCSAYPDDFWAGVVGGPA